MAEEESKPFNYIPEVILKKRKSNEAWALRKKAQLERRNFQSKNTKDLIKKPEDFVLEYRNRELDLIRMKHRVKRKRTELLTPNSKPLIIIRIQGKKDMHAKTRKVLYSLGLRRIFNAVFVEPTEGIMGKLQRVEPYVTYGKREVGIIISQIQRSIEQVYKYKGDRWKLTKSREKSIYPNLKSIKDLIYKKGHARIDKRKVPLTDNNIIEQELGKFGVVCIEDMVHQIENVGPHFREVVRFMWPFELNKPAEGLKGSKTLFNDGGDTGNREDLINDLLNKMN